MSHFSVAVFHREDQSIESLLSPFDENKQVEPYIEYTRQEAEAFMDEAKAGASKFMKDHFGMGEPDSYEISGFTNFDGDDILVLAVFDFN